jgi:hypothetical protein
VVYAAVTARRKQPPKDLTGIRQRGGTYQVGVSAGYDPVTGRQLMLSGSADTEDAAVLVRDWLRAQVPGRHGSADERHTWLPADEPPRGAAWSGYARSTACHTASSRKIISDGPA